MQTWQIGAIDVWGNAHDGYEINDQHWCDETFTCDSETSDVEMLKALRRALGHRADARGYTIEVTEYDLIAYRARDGKPAYIARLVTND